MLNAILMMLVLGALLGLGLGLASKFLHVQPDERVDTVAGMLPGYNCGGCGYPGCSGFASAMVEGDTDEFKCRPCKADKKKEIIDYLKNTPGPDGKTVTIKGSENRILPCAGSGFLSVPGMAQILLVKVQSRAFVAKCSEPQAESSNAQVKAVV